MGRPRTWRRRLNQQAEKPLWRIQAELRAGGLPCQRRRTRHSKPSTQSAFRASPNCKPAVDAPSLLWGPGSADQIAVFFLDRFTINADPEFRTSVLWRASIALDHAALHFNRAAHGVY